MTTNLKETFASKFETIDHPKAQAFAQFIRSGNQDGTNACWGAMAERFDQEFTDDEDRIPVWPKLIEIGDPRAMLLFIHLSRNRPKVMSELFQNANQLPRFIQRALVSFEETEPQANQHLGNLHPAAKELVQAEPKTMRRHRRIIRARIAKLMARRFTAPGNPDQEEESNGGYPWNIPRP